MSNLKLDEFHIEGIGAIPSASTVDLENATGDLIDISGTTTITRIILYGGHERTVRFTGALTLTNSSTLVCPGNANITTVAGSFAVIRGYASGVVRIVSYTPFGQTPQAALVGTTTLAVVTDPGTGAPSAAVGGTVGTLIFGYVAFDASGGDASETFAIETAPASGVYTSVVVVGGNSAVAVRTISGSFSFFVPTGYRWRHTTVGAATLTAISAVVL